MLRTLPSPTPIAEPPKARRVSHAGLAMPRRLGAILSLSAGSILYSLDANIANIALPEIAQALAISQSTAVLIVSTYNLALAMILLPLAAIGDRIGHRKLFTIGFIAYITAATGAFFAHSFVALVAARAAQAVAAAALLSVAFGMIRTIYPSSALGRGMGFNTVMSSGGAAVAPVLGGFLISVASWHWVFVAGVPLAVVGLLSSAALPDSELSTEPYDTWGAVLCALTFGLLIVGFQGLGDGMSGVAVGAILGGGLCVAALFVWHERRISLPVLPVDLLARPKLALSVGAALLAVLASTALLLYLPFRLSALGFSAPTVGAMIAPYAFAIVVAAPASGMLSDRVSPHLLGLLGLAIATAGTAAFIWLPDEPSYVDIAWRSAICGVGFSMFFSPNGRIMITSVPSNRLAGASSLLSTTRMFGQALGSAMLGGLLAVTALPKLPIVTAAAIVAAALLCAAVRITMKDDGGES